MGASAKWRAALPAFAGVAVALLAVGCSREHRLLARANAEHAAHDLDAALDTLEEIVSVAPGSREAAEARGLGAAWGIEGSEASVAEGRMRFLERAHRLAPKSGGVAARKCRLAAEDGVDSLRVCLDLELLGKEAIPEAIVAPLRARVMADDEERDQKRLLASDDPDDWRTLRTKYPSSPFAEAANARWLDRISICPSLSSLRARMRRELDTSEDTTLENAVRLAIEPRTLVTTARTRAASLHATAREVADHEALDEERKLRDLIVASFEAFSRGSTVFGDEVERSIRAHDLNRYARALAAYVHGKRSLVPAIEGRFDTIERLCESPASKARLAAHGLDAPAPPTRSSP